VHRYLCGLAAATALFSLPAVADAAEAAVATLTTADGREVGSVSLLPASFPGLILTFEASGMPAGTHGFHLHETGTCDPSDGFKSAGGHWNPTDHSHGWLDGEGAHAGDMPNIHVPESGELTIEYFLPDLALGDGGGAANVMDADGTAIIVHSGVDDYLSQPSGEAGDRIACGVVEMN